MTDANPQHLANIANSAIRELNQYLFIKGIDNLSTLDKATVLTAIGKFLIKKAWLMMEEGEANESD